MATIAEQAGVCRGTLYRHFETREQLLDSIADHLLVIFAAELERATRDAATPHDRVAAVIEHHRRFAHRPRTRQLRELQPAFVLDFMQSVFTELCALTEQGIAPAFDASHRPLAFGAADFADLATRVLVTNCVFASDRSERATNALLRCWDLPASVDQSGASSARPAARSRTRGSPPRTTKERAARSVPHRILDGAVEVLARSSTARPSISDVAESAGVSRGTVYRHFPDRDALLEALADHLHAEFQRGYEQALDTTTNPRDRVRAAIDFTCAHTAKPQILRLQELQPEFIVQFVADRFEDLVALHRRAVDAVIDADRPTGHGAIDADAIAEIFTRAFLSLSLVTPGRPGRLPVALMACWDGVAAVPHPVTGAAPRARESVTRNRPSVGPRAAVVA
jgi:AcrR family transcriptional regulator